MALLTTPSIETFGLRRQTQAFELVVSKIGKSAADVLRRIHAVSTKERKKPISGVSMRAVKSAHNSLHQMEHGKVDQHLIDYASYLRLKQE